MLHERAQPAAVFDDLFVSIQNTPGTVPVVQNNFTPTIELLMSSQLLL